MGVGRARRARLTAAPAGPHDAPAPPRRPHTPLWCASAPAAIRAVRRGRARSRPGAVIQLVAQAIESHEGGLGALHPSPWSSATGGRVTRPCLRCSCVGSVSRRLVVSCFFQFGTWAFISALNSLPWFGTRKCRSSWAITKSMKPASRSTRSEASERSPGGRAGSPLPASCAGCAHEAAVRSGVAPTTRPAHRARRAARHSSPLSPPSSRSEAMRSTVRARSSPSSASRGR